MLPIVWSKIKYIHCLRKFCLKIESALWTRFSVKNLKLNDEGDLLKKNKIKSLYC